MGTSPQKQAQIRTLLFLGLFLCSFLIGSPFVLNAVMSDADPSESVPPDEPSVSTTVTTTASTTVTTTATTASATTSVTSAASELGSTTAATVSTTVTTAAPTDTTDTTTTTTVTTTTTLATRTFTTAAPEYFDNALFIGDSRTEGLRSYSGIKTADFFSDKGMSVYKIDKATVSVPSVGSTGLSDLLKKKTYGKIYVMLGINELGYNRTNTVKRYADLIERIHAAQPQATVFICANLHVSAKRSAGDKVVNNANIDDFNHRIAQLADNRTFFYIDINEKFDDENGNLRADLTSDGTHIYGKYYAEWATWLREKAVL